jgi:hypothetical protein
MSHTISRISTPALTWNGALSHASTGDGPLATLLDYWSKAGTYRGRDQAAVDADMRRSSPPTSASPWRWCSAPG